MTGRAAGLRASRTVGVLLASLLLASCAVTEQRLARESTRIDDLQARLVRVEQSALEGQRNRSEPSLPPDLAGRVADVRQQVEALAADVRSLAGRVDSIETRATRGSDPELERRVTVLAEKVRALEGRGVAVTPPSSTPAQPAAPSRAAPATPTPPPTSPPSPPAQPPKSPQAAYDEAYALYKQGKYDECREAFREYIRQFPDSNLTDNAYFWVGESYYDQGQYEKAILEYDKVVQKFPNGDKAASALLKQAFAFDAINDPVDAKILLKKLLREHPSSEQAAIAKKKLEMLGD